MSPDEERLLEQLAVVAFRNTENNYLPLPIFPHAKPVQMARLPVERKQGEEGQNNLLFKSRIENGRRWIDHLPGSFNDQLISTMFLDIDQDVATKTVKEYYSTKLRLGPENSASLKIYASLNDKAYERINRMLYYLLGVRVLALIERVRKIRKPC